MKKAKPKQTQAWMSPTTLQELSQALWGEKWRDAFQEQFDISYSQLHRYMTVYKGQTIPKAIAMALDMLTTLKANDIPAPTLEEYRCPIKGMQKVIFVPERKPKVPRVIDDAEEIDLFSDPEPAKTPRPKRTKTEPAETKPEPDRTKTEPEPAKNRKAKPEAKASKAKPKAAAKPKPAKAKAAA